MAPKHVAEIQATGSATHPSQLGCVDEISAFQSQPIFTRLDDV